MGDGGAWVVVGGGWRGGGGEGGRERGGGGTGGVEVTHSSSYQNQTCECDTSLCVISKFNCATHHST